jgi:hypothetical protein
LLVRELAASDRKLACASPDWYCYAAADLDAQALRAALLRLEFLLQARQVHVALREQLEQPAQVSRQ